MNNSLPFDQVIKCDFPDSDQLRTAFLNLPNQGRVEVTCSVADLSTILGDLAGVGFFGMRILMSDIAGPLARISAFKGKNGPCYNTGRTATYTGAALAALDDDGHLLFGPTAICEKTASIYRSKIYRDVVQVSEPDQVLFDRLKTHPEPFNCDNFEQNVRVLIKHERFTKQTGERTEMVFYPGPFRLLILADGEILKRGQVTTIARINTKNLQKSDKCILLSDAQHVQPVSAEYIQDVYRSRGSIALLETENITGTIGHSDHINLNSLDTTSKQMRMRLQKLIARRENYFILSGSDPWDIYGCCPSDEIGAANRLVESGILSSWQTSKHRNSCPCTVYAFNGEIQNTGSKPSFSENTILRDQVLNRITHYQYLWGKNTIVFLRFVLLIFVALSIIFTVYGAPEINTALPDNSTTAFSGDKDVVIVYVAHFGISCSICENMKRLTQLTLNHYFANEIKNGKLKYQTINIDDPKNASLVRYFNLYSNGLIFAHKQNGTITDHKIIKDRIWFLSHSDDEFTDMIREELSLFISKFK